MSRDAVSKGNTVANSINRSCGSNNSDNKIISRLFSHLAIIHNFNYLYLSIFILYRIKIYIQIEIILGIVILCLAQFDIKSIV